MKSFVLIFVSVLSFSAWSTDEPAPKENIEAPKPTSADNRKDKSFVITGEIIGQGPSGSNAQGLNLGYYITPNSLLMLELNGGHSSVGDGFFFGFDGQTNKTGYSVGILSKNFIGNSFYLKGGITFRTLDYEYIDKDWLAGGKTRRGFSGDSTALSFAFGSQWQRSNFTIGCDWFGLEAPVLTRVYDQWYSANATANDRNRNREDIVTYVTGVGLTFTRFYVGASF